MQEITSVLTPIEGGEFIRIHFAEDNRLPTDERVVHTVYDKGWRALDFMVYAKFIVEWTKAHPEIKWVHLISEVNEGLPEMLGNVAKTGLSLIDNSGLHFAQREWSLPAN